MSPPDGAPVAAVFGSARLEPGAPEYEEGVRLGRLLAERGWVVQTGGYDGAMGAVSSGAHAAGGHVVGVTLRGLGARKAPNRWLLEEREAEDLFARVRGLIEADAWIALSGGIGTLAEVALAWNLHQLYPTEARPLVLVGPRWPELLETIGRVMVVGERDLDLVHVVRDASAAVDLVTRARTVPVRGAPDER